MRYCIAGGLTGKLLDIRVFRPYSHAKHDVRRWALAKPRGMSLSFGDADRKTVDVDVFLNA
jgi:hypothetical protein